MPSKGMFSNFFFFSKTHQFLFCWFMLLLYPNQVLVFIKRGFVDPYLKKKKRLNTLILIILKKIKLSPCILFYWFILFKKRLNTISFIKEGFLSYLQERETVWFINAIFWVNSLVCQYMYFGCVVWFVNICLALLC